MALSRGSKWFLAVALLFVAAGAAGVWWLDQNVFVDEVEPGQSVAYEVARGASVRAVADDLAELGVVRSGVRLRLAAEEEGLSQTLQPGLFEFETGMEVDDAVAILAAGPVTPPQIRFTVQEGLTVEQTLERLAEQFDDHDVADFRAVLDERTEAGTNAPGVLQIPEWVPEPGDIEDDLIEPYEGVLFPETYDVADDATPLDILQRMVEQLGRVLATIPDELIADAEARERTLYENLVLASLIERETRVDDERGIIAGVIENRLEEGMRLQIDATVVYALGGGPRQQVFFSDLEIDHPHNTYRIDGLPPTPIAGAGAASLRAAFEPDDVPFRFYVLDAACDGSHVFAETGEQHEVNVQAFRDANRCLEEDLDVGTDG